MDGLREIAATTFRLYNKFRDPIPKTAEENAIQTFTIVTEPNGTFQFNKTSLSEESVPLRLEKHNGQSRPVPGKPPPATLQMTVIIRSHEEVIGMTKSNFLRLFESFNLDPYVLNYISQNWYGFHHCNTPHNDAYTVFIGTVPFTILFSYNPTTYQTSAIFLARIYNGLNSGQQVVKEFSEILNQYANRIDIPQILVLVALIHLGKWQDAVLYKMLQMIRSAEDVSGYGPSGRASKRVNIDDLLGVQWKIGEIVLGLANVDRHHEIAKSLLESLNTDLEEWSSSSFGVADGKTIWSKMGLDEVVNVLGQQFAGANSTSKYLRERTQCHSAVVSAR